MQNKSWKWNLILTLEHASIPVHLNKVDYRKGRKEKVHGS